MEVGANTLYLGLSPKILTQNRTVNVCVSTFASKQACLSLHMRYHARELHERAKSQYIHAVGAAPSGLAETGVSSQFEDFSVTTASTNKDNELKINVVVSGAKTQEIFDLVFMKMVADAQPIPGFRRVKGGKTPDIPRDILLEVLGPSNVYKQVIKKVINSAIAEYVEKEGLKVSKDLRIEQSFEDLEATFEAGDRFSFDAIVRC